MEFPAGDIKNRICVACGRTEVRTAHANRSDGLVPEDFRQKQARIQQLGVWGGGESPGKLRKAASKLEEDPA